MGRFVRKSKYERILAERERLVQVLAEQVEYLRAQLQMPTRTVSEAVGAPPELNFSDIPEEIKLESVGALSDDEEQLAAMLQVGVISQAEHDSAIEHLRSRTADDIIE